MDAWQKDFGEAFVRIGDLLHYLEISPKDQKAFLDFNGGDFPLRVPRPFAERMEKGDLKDPLLLQVLASALEQISAPGFNVDPVGDQVQIRSKSMIQKYRGRALIITTGACAIHCRYCFRKAFPYDQHSVSPRHTEQLIEEITQDPSLSEIILSGGDPLSLSDDRIAALIQEIATIPHIKTLRIHTRLPVVIPNRVTSQLIYTLDTLSLQKIMVIHANHPKELDGHVENKMKAIRQTGTLLLNQSVLLKGVNDDANTLIQLSQRLLECGVLPYYLHLLDRIEGSQHFEVAEPIARDLVASIRAELPGYLVPRLVREIEGQPSKTPI